MAIYFKKFHNNNICAHKNYLLIRNANTFLQILITLTQIRGYIHKLFTVQKQTIFLKQFEICILLTVESHTHTWEWADVCSYNQQLCASKHEVIRCLLYTCSSTYAMCTVCSIVIYMLYLLFWLSETKALQQKKCVTHKPNWY